MQAPDQLVAYAKQIAIYRGYGNLENGLQPFDVLNAKYEHEQEEFAEAVASGNIWHMYHEAADLLYYSACIGAQMSHSGPDPLPYYEYYKQFQTIRAAGLNHKHAEKAALVKYHYRASAPNTKNEACEIELIRNAL